MIPRLGPTLRWLAPLLPVGLIAAIILVLAWFDSKPLPFPTPAQQELVVLVQPGSLTFDNADPNNTSGFEHDLIELFAKELGIGIRHVIAPPGEFSAQLKAHNVHLAAAWLTPQANTEYSFSPAFMQSHDVLVQHEASLPIDEIKDLAGRTVHVLAGSRQAAAMQAFKKEISGLQVVELQRHTPLDLLEAVASGRHDLAVVDSAQFNVAQQLTPSLQASLEIGDPHPVAWAFPKNANTELVARATDFLTRIRKDPDFARMKDRYFGHIHRLKNDDIRKFVELSKTQLPRLRRHFHAAQTATGLDWRLLAALAYQESKWDANATSPTGVRGVMMLTEDTADRMGVSNRLDAEESILAGARYLGMLRGEIPEDTREPDRTWLALSAYNIGPGHFRAGLRIGRQLKADTRAWHEMKRILPLLAKPQYYERLKSGRARGGEAVILVENVRNYFDILKRHEAPYRSGSVDSLDIALPGLKLKKPGKKLQASPMLSLPTM